MKKTIDSFEVPPLTIEPEYGAIVDRIAALHEEMRAAKKAARDLEVEAKETPTAVSYGAGVAALLGETADDKPHVRVRLAEARKRVADIEAAIEILERRRYERKGAASLAVIEKSRGEYGKRVAAVVSALETLEAARREYDALVSDFIVNDVEWTRLGPLSLGWVGDSGPDGRVARIAKEARSHGYV